jgi:uncharacterized protein involved in outer membrane biogenesis
MSKSRCIYSRWRCKICELTTSQLTSSRRHHRASEHVRQSNECSVAGRQLHLAAARKLAMVAAMLKRVFKWLLGLFLLGVVLLVIFLLSLDTLLRVLVVHNIRAQTGMVVEIGKFHLGLREPVVTITDLKIHNPPGFGGAPFLNIPEIHVEYDRDALAKNQIHVTLLRFNLGELDIVKNAAGQTNLLQLGLALPAKKTVKAEAGSKQLAEFKKQTGLDFAGIDTLKVSIGTAKFIDLADPKNNREQKIGIENQVVPHVKSAADLTGLLLLVTLRSDGFFNTLIAPADLK